MNADERGATDLAVADAARRLGVSEQAVLQQIKAYTLVAVKVDGTWRVTLPGQKASIPRWRRRPAGSIYAPAQLARVQDELLVFLVKQVEAVSREAGCLRAERDAAMAERDRLQDECRPWWRRLWER